MAGRGMDLLHSINEFLGSGVDPRDLTFLQISLRGVIVFVLTLAMIRLGDKRFLSRKTAFDAVLGVLLASMLARAVNGSGAFWPTLGGGFVLVLLHRLIAFSSRRWNAFGTLVKGTSDMVIRDGKVIQSALAANDMSRDDLLEDLRLHGKVDRPEDVRIAYIERNGQTSVVPKE